MLRLSPSSLGVFKSCPKCFWLSKNEKLERPRGIFSSLPNGIDLILKTWYDEHRAKGILPPEIQKDVLGSLFPDVDKLNRWRNWRTGLKCDVDGVELFGALDDLLIDPVEGYSPLDYKTKGSLPKDGDSERYYSHQLDAYALMQRENGMPQSGHAFLAYYSPLATIGALAGTAQFHFACTVVKLECDPERAVQMVKDAAACLAGPIPEASDECEYCPYIEKHADRKESVA